MNPDQTSLRAQLDALISDATAAVRRGVRTEAEPPSLPPYGPYHEAAAVLSAFEPDELAPAPSGGPRTDHDEEVEQLLRSSERFVDADGHERRALIDDIRREVLAQMGTRARIEAAIRANTELAEQDPVARMLLAYLQGIAPRVEKQNAEEVAATLQLSQWLTGAHLGDVLPPGDDVRARSELLALLQPFEELAGAHFAGRTVELQRLRDHVGVLPPGSFKERMRRVAREKGGIQRKPPLVIHGPGGVGKSALIARFIWEHVTLPDTERFPFAYLDLDRGALLPDEPLTLLAEAVRQLGLQRNEYRRFADSLRRELQPELVERSRARTTNRQRTSLQQATSVPLQATSQPVDWEPYIRNFADLLKHVKAGQDPFLFVLDTFEEVQYRGDVVTGALAKFLRMFQHYVPRLRIVISGRAEVELPGTATDPLPLGNFDDDAAQEYLLARGVRPPALAASIVRRFGGSPLTLRLAAEAWRPEEGDLADVATRGALGRRLADQMVQGQLYRRILGHVHDERVQKLAHPGLVLRRLTPELIQNVLAVPCKVAVPDITTATELFDVMAREVSLVRVEGAGPHRVLLHRRDVRRVMIRLLRASEADTVRQIEKAAVAWYESSERAADRAEEVYHRLSLQQPLDIVAGRWMPGIEQDLFDALDDNELEAPERAWLASRLNRSLSADERAAADQETWERDTRRRVIELLSRGEADAALRAVAVRTKRSPGSPLFALEASALISRGRLEQARGVLHAGVRSLEDRTDPDASFDLMLRSAALDLRGNAPATARKTLERARRLLDPDSDSLHWLELGLVEMEADLTEGVDPVASGRVDDLVSRLALVTDKQLSTNQLTAVAAGAQLGSHNTEVLRRVVAATGLGARRRAPLRQLARALAQWDREVSRQRDHWQGALGGDALPWGETLTNAWTRYVLETEPMARGRWVASLLADHDPPVDVTEALTGILRETTGTLVAETLGADEPATDEPVSVPGSLLAAGAEVPEFGASAGYRDVGVRLSPERRAQLIASLTEAFHSRGELAEMVRHRLHRSLDAIAPTDSFVVAVELLVKQSQLQGWTATLLAAALESRPDNPELHAIAEQLGLAAAVPPLPAMADRVQAAGGFIDEASLRVRLGVLVARVCRVEVRTLDRHVHGTGFLVGPDLVLTAYHLVRPIAEGLVRPASAQLRFDYKALPDGSTVTAGTLFGLRGTSWLVDHSPEPGRGPRTGEPSLNFALLRIAGAPGAEPIGGDRAEPDAAPRGWVAIPTRPHSLVPGSRIYVVHQPDEGPLEVSLAPGGVRGTADDGTRVLYNARTGPASSGAPCFGHDLELVAMHEQQDNAGIGYAVPLDLILEQFDQRGVRAVLDPPRA